MQTQTAQRTFVPRRRVLFVLLAALMLVAFAAFAVESYVRNEPAASQAAPATPLVMNRPSDRPFRTADGTQSKPCVPKHVPTDRLYANLGVTATSDDC